MEIFFSNTMWTIIFIVAFIVAAILLADRINSHYLFVGEDKAIRIYLFMETLILQNQPESVVKYKAELKFNIEPHVAKTFYDAVLACERNVIYFQF